MSGFQLELLLANALSALVLFVFLALARRSTNKERYLKRLAKLPLFLLPVPLIAIPAAGPLLFLFVPGVLLAPTASCGLLYRELEVQKAEGKQWRGLAMLYLTALLCSLILISRIETGRFPC